MTVLPDLTDQMLRAARAAGADAADAMVVQGVSNSVDVREGALEQAERAEGIDLGLRVFVGQRQANVSTSDASARTIEEMAARAVAMAREAPEDAYAGLADPDALSDRRDAAGLELHDPTPEPSPADLHAAALAAGGADEGQPGFRANYGPQFYVGYLRDPQGNKIALFSSNPDEPGRDD